MSGRCGSKDRAIMFSLDQEIPILTEFEQVADRSAYISLPANWQVGIADVVNSSEAIAAGRYKSVNFAGAATIGALSNALGGKIPLFAFGGDGAHFAVPPGQAAAASTALSQVSAWAKRELNLEMRVGMIGINDIRLFGFEVGVAYWQASSNTKYGARRTIPC